MKNIFGFVLVVAFVGCLSFVGYKAIKYYKEPVPQAINIRTVLEKEMGGLKDGISGTENSRSVLENVAEDSVELDEIDNNIIDENIAISGVDEMIDSDVGYSGEIVDSGFQSTLPEELNLSAVFYAQAPFGNWDYPWEEACEEASVLLAANAYYGHNWTASQFNDEILKLVDWEVETFGDYVHTTVAQTSQILTEYLRLSVKVHENPSYDDIRSIIANGHLIVAPFAGKLLYNPFYKNGGPVYHMMLIKGYKNGDKIITHDVGTRRGEDYVYKWGVLDNALHDYDEPIESGAQKIIEILPPVNE